MQVRISGVHSINYWINFLSIFSNTHAEIFPSTVRTRPPNQPGDKCKIFLWYYYYLGQWQSRSPIINPLTSICGEFKTISGHVTTRVGVMKRLDGLQPWAEVVSRAQVFPPGNIHDLKLPDLTLHLVPPLSVLHWLKAVPTWGRTLLPQSLGNSDAVPRTEVQWVGTNCYQAVRYQHHRQHHHHHEGDCPDIFRGKEA